MLRNADLKQLAEERAARAAAKQTAVVVEPDQAMATATAPTETLSINSGSVSNIADTMATDVPSVADDILRAPVICHCPTVPSSNLLLSEIAAEPEDDTQTNDVYLVDGSRVTRETAEKMRLELVRRQNLAQFTGSGGANLTVASHATAQSALSIFGNTTAGSNVRSTDNVTHIVNTTVARVESADNVTRVINSTDSNKRIRRRGNFAGFN